MKKLIFILAGVFLTTSLSLAATIEVNQFSPTPVANSWYLSDMRLAGTASIVDLAGLGGNGAAKLTTGNATGDKAEVGTFGNFGLASTLLRDITIGYEYYKQSVTDGNIFAAPSIKLTLSTTGGTGDNYGSLIYEPNWNIGAGSIAPTSDAWQTVSINQSTGAGSINYGGWWWSGGFEIGNSAGDVPFRSLAEWVTAFQTSDRTDFDNANVVGLSMGVGTYNLNQIGYFDNVSMRNSTGSLDVVYDFKAGAPVPEPATMMLFGFGLLGVARVFRRKN